MVHSLDEKHNIKGGMHCTNKCMFCKQEQNKQILSEFIAKLSV